MSAGCRPDVVRLDVHRHLIEELERRARRTARPLEDTTELLHPGQLVDEAPLLGDPAASDPEDRDLGDRDRAPGRRDPPEGAPMGAARGVAADDAIALLDEVVHRFVPVGKRRAYADDGLRDAVEPVTLGQLGRGWEVGHEIVGVHRADSGDVARVPEFVKLQDQRLVAHAFLRRAGDPTLRARGAPAATGGAA